MEGKRLDLDAPLVSFRRITTSSAPLKDAVPRSQRGPLLSPHVANSGTVPFIWEKSPGQPKDNYVDVAGAAAGLRTAAPNLPPGRIMKNASRLKPSTVRTQSPITCLSDCRAEKSASGGVESNHSDCVDESDIFTGARDILSCPESFSMKSSLTGLSAGPSFRYNTSQFSKDPQMEEFMMGRFLPAAQAMASGSTKRSWKKPPRAPVVGENLVRKTVSQRRIPLHYQYQLSVAASHGNGKKEEQQDGEEEEESDEIRNYESMGYLSSKACGLIPRFGLNSSFCLLNPATGMKVRDLPPTMPRRRPTPRINISHHEGNVEDSWEAVYRYRLRNVDYIQKDDGSNLASESNQLTYWSDSQMPDGSSSFHHSSGADLSPNNNEDVKTKSRSSKTGSFDSCEEDSGSYWKMVSSIGRLQGSGSTSPAFDRTPYINSSQLPNTSNSNSSLVNMTAGTKETIDSTKNIYTLLSEFQRREEIVVAETSGEYPLQSKFSRVAESDLSSYSRRLNCEENNGNDFKNNESHDEGLNLKADGQEKNDNSMALSLLPPPLPKPPSDSWLQRTLPSISTKGPYQQSFLGIQFHPRNQALQASRGDQKFKIQEKSSKMHHPQTTFAGVPKPEC